MLVCLFYSMRVCLGCVQHESPSSEPGLDQGCVEQATKAWADFKAKPHVFTIDMQGLIPFSELGPLQLY